MRLLFSFRYTLIVLLSFLFSCAAKPKGEMIALVKDSAGLWTGLWQGFILPFSLFGKIFNLNIGIHETSYSGAMYWIGYFIGLVLLVRFIVFFAMNIEKSH